MLKIVQSAVALTILAFAFFLLAEVVRESSSYQECKAKAAQEQSNQPYEKETPHILVTLVGRNSIIFRCVGEVLDKTDAVIAAIATALLTIVTGGLVLIGYMQIRTTRAQLRAYVFPISSIINKLNTGETPECHVVIKNTGQTPAYKLTHLARFALVNFPMDGPLLAIGKAPKEFSRTHIGPGGELHKRDPAPRSITIEDINRLKVGTAAIYVYGEIRYIDVFSGKRVTTYRFMTGGSVGFRSDGAMATCQEGNEAN